MIKLEPSKTKWYMYLWLWMFKTKSVQDVSTERGQELTITVYYKEVRDNIYVVKEVFKVREAKGRHARKLRGKNK